MQDTVRTKWARRRPFASPAARASTPAASPRRCPYCCDPLPADARKCRSCGEWLVRTSGGMSAVLLRVVAWLWLALSALAAGGMWLVGSALREWALSQDVGAIATPWALDVVRAALVGLVLLQGITVALGLNVLARLAPRRPSWWA